MKNPEAPVVKREAKKIGDVSSQRWGSAAEYYGRRLVIGPTTLAANKHDHESYTGLSTRESWSSVVLGDPSTGVLWH